jgi:hypothetical protein
MSLQREAAGFADERKQFGAGFDETGGFGNGGDRALE